MAVSDASVVPRVAVAVFVLNEDGYVLVGKRTGSHGAGTLALPGGHLELHESFAECAAREVAEETGLTLQLSPTEAGATPLQFLTALNSVHLKDEGESGHGRHYVTIFIKASVLSKPNEKATATIMEPNKCLGWVWMPMSYLRYAVKQQHQRQGRLHQNPDLNGQTEAAGLSHALKQSNDPAWAVADNFARGLPLFQPLVNLLSEHPELQIP